MTDRTTAIGWSRLGRLLLLGTAAALLSTATAWAQFPNDFKFGDSEDFTIGLWLNSDVTQSTDVSLLSNKDWGSGNNVGYVMTLDDNGSGGNEWKVNVDTTGDVRADTAWTTVDLSNWHFVVATFNRATQEVTAYTDGGGALTAALAAGSIDTWSDTPGLGLDMNIAQDGTGQYAGGQSYNGLMDDVAVWNRVLTASEINYLYSQGLAGHDLGSLFGTTAPGAGSTINTGLTALYDFEGNTNDVSGSPNVNNGVWKAGNGGTTGTFGSSRTGFGNAADFDGLSFITIGESADAVLVDWTGNSAANNNFNNPGNWTSDPSGWTAGTQINIGAGTSSFGDAPGAQSGPALLHNGDNFSVGVATFGADGQTTFVDMSNGTLYADGNDDSTIGPANSTVSLRMTDATMNVRTGAEEGAELDVAKDGSTVNLTASGTSRLAAGNLVPDANFATGYRRPVAADGVARVGDDIKFGNGGTLTATLGGNTEVFAPDVFYVNDSAGGSTEVVQNDNSKVIANWDTRWFDTDSHTSDQVVNWTLNDNSEFRVARDHGLGETAGDGTINVTVNDNATFFAGDRIVIGADGGNVNVVLNGGLMKVGGNSETDKLYVDETGAPTDNDPLNQPLAIDWILHMGGGASANLDVNGGTAEIGRSAYIGRGGGTAQVTVNAGSFNVLGVGPDGTGLGNAPGGGVA
ncbi:MAG: LamG domain-containing protein, partial [Planctomycetales bacterium]|nr:LamG domain-containing protein [Planctomycetales bacterium]